MSRNQGSVGAQSVGDRRAIGAWQAWPPASSCTAGRGSPARARTERASRCRRQSGSPRRSPPAGWNPRGMRGGVRREGRREETGGDGRVRTRPRTCGCSSQSTLGSSAFMYRIGVCRLRLVDMKAWSTAHTMPFSSASKKCFGSSPRTPRHSGTCASSGVATAATLRIAEQRCARGGEGRREKGSEGERRRGYLELAPCGSPSRGARSWPRRSGWGRA